MRGRAQRSSFRRFSCAFLLLAGALMVGCASAEAGPSRAEVVFHGEGDPAAQALVGRWIEALGGMEAYWAAERARYTLTTEMWDATTGRLRRTRPRYVTIARTPEGLHTRIERWEGDDFIAQGWYPGGQWATMNGESLVEGDKDYDEADYVGGDVHYWFGLPFKLTDPGVHIRDEGTDAEDRQVVRVTFNEGVGDHQDTWRYYFTDAGSWPVQVDYTEDGRTNVNQTRWEDIQQAGGFYYVGRRVHFDEDGRTWKVLAVGDVEINPELPATVFSTP